MNRIELVQFLDSFFASLKTAGARADVKPLFDLASSFDPAFPLSIPILRELAEFGSGGCGVDQAGKMGLLQKRLNRIYLRLCQVQDELSHLDLKKAVPDSSRSQSLEDYVFSQIDFSRYREIESFYFEALFADGMEDFSEVFFRKNFSLGRKEIKSLVEESYKKDESFYKLKKGNPFILSVIRTLETSLESLPLFTVEEIDQELKNLLALVGAGEVNDKFYAEAGKVFSLLVFSLDNAKITHRDGMTTKLFISGEGELSGTFRPANKPWTRVLIPAV